MDFYSILSGALGSIIAGFIAWQLGIFKYLIKQSIDYSFQKELEKHKHNLTQISEATKFDIQRKIYDFNLYTTRRHDIYRELYKKILISQGNIYNLYGFRSATNLENLKPDELREFIESYKFPNLINDDIIKTFTHDKKEGLESLDLYIRKQEFDNASEAIRIFKNLYLESKLFLSSEIDELINTILKNMELLFHMYKLCEHINKKSILDSNIYDADNEKYWKDIIDNNIIKLCNKMKEELRKGDY